MQEHTPMIVEEPPSIPQHKYQIKSPKNYSMASPFHTLKLYDHAAVCWGRYMFIWGGDNNRLSKIPIKKQANFHKIQLDNFTWETIQGSALVPAHVHSHCYQMIGHEMFIFGGSDETCKSNNIMWGYNFIAKVFKKYNGQNPPTPRESASMVKLGDGILLYGGINLEVKEIYNDFYLFEIKTMTWHPLTPNKQIPIRTLQKMVAIGKHAYLFGGNNESGVNSLNDFYRITLVNKKQCNVQKIETVMTPPSRMGHGMIVYAEKYIVIIGGQKQLKKKSEYLNDAWIFDTQISQWEEIDMMGKFQPRSHFSIVDYRGQLVIFGGMKQQGVDDTIAMFQIEKLEDFENKQRERIKYEKSYLSNPPKKRPNFDFLLKASNLIKFPFAAFGLLIDNCINTQATIININIIDRHFCSPFKNSRLFSDKQSSPLKGPDEVQRYIIIEDNGKAWSNQQLPHIIFNIQTVDFLALDVSDKKTRVSAQKQNLKREFGNNLKFGSFRLGKGFLYISSYEDNYLRVGLMAGGKSLCRDGDFVSYYYCEDLKTRKFLTEDGAETKRMIEVLCKSILRPRSLEDLSFYNQLYIFDLESFYTVRGTFYELNPYNNDFIFNCLHQVEFLDKINFPILECPDVSLRSYLSLLYLKMQTKITLQTNKKSKQEIQNQLFIDKIDRQKEKGYVKEIEYANLYPELAECKIVELYYDQAMDERCDSFHAGILIYHKNRLICRYKYELGRLFQSKFYARRYRKGKTNVLQFFGYIELPDEMKINVFKTGVQCPILLQGFNSNIQLIVKDMQRRLQSQSKPETIPNKLEIHDKFGEQKLRVKHFARKEVVIENSNLQHWVEDVKPSGNEEQKEEPEKPKEVPVLNQPIDLQSDDEYSGSEEEDEDSEYAESVPTPINNLKDNEEKNPSSKKKH